MIPPHVLDVLTEFRDGCHGESELRAVAEFLLDAMNGNADEYTTTRHVVALCNSLRNACQTVRTALLDSHP